MNRFLLLTALSCVLTAPMLTAQAQAPAKPAKYIAPVKGLATIEVIQSSRRVGKEWVTKVKVRNTSKGSINLLKADEYWYDANVKIVSAGQYAHKKAPIRPGEIVEITLRSPDKPGIQRNHIIFSHAYGKVDAKLVKAFK